MITREEAVCTLYEFINSGLLSEEMEDKLQDIATCIDHENDGVHLWGADDDCNELFVSKRSDLITDEYIVQLGEIWGKYHFEPSYFEAEEIQNHLSGEE